MKLLCEDPVFSEYIKVILMEERTFLNNNTAYSFLTCFLHKVGDQRRGALAFYPLFSLKTLFSIKHRFRSSRPPAVLIWLMFWSQTC